MLFRSDGVTLDNFAITPGSAPNFLTEGPDGNIWFTNFDGNSVQAMNTSGATVALFATGTPSSRPFGITSSGGYIWYTMYDGNIVARMTTAGVMDKFQVTTGNAKPSLIIQGPGSNIFFSEVNNNAIGKLVVSTINPSGGGGGTTPSAPNTSALASKTNTAPIALGVLALLATVAVVGFWAKTELKKKK